jgi:RHS repeat-associated protein
MAQIETATDAIAWYFNDHLRTPILQTDAFANVIWRIEREPFGKMFEVRAGPSRHQLLAFPGQEDEGGETAYNIFRWYSAGRGRYTQPDPLGVGGLGHGSGELFHFAIQRPRQAAVT